MYAFCLEQPTKDIAIKSLGKSANLNTQKIRSITLLGSDEVLEWKVKKEALIIKKPKKLPDFHVIGLKIEFE
ncbi:hypothetical protein M601_009170 [Cellulophaga baltica 4]|nr:hypothetical protein M601_009170 [Cellulophaga baltica 4]